jgi:RNA polymerase sigma-B factor
METLTAGKASVTNLFRDSVPAQSAVTPIRQLPECPDRELLEIIRSQPQGSERRAAACELLVTRHRNLVWSCVRHYNGSPESTDDLMQVGYLGLMKAINNFDPAVGGSLAAYAQPCIIGEIKRHFRDKRWQVHVTRSVQELVLQVRDATSELTHELGHAPSEAALAEHLDISIPDLREARQADLAFRPCSLDAPLSDQPDAATLGDLLGADDPGVEHVLGMQSLAAHWDELPRREQRIVLMRFFGDMTQSDIGQQLGISQMHVSRLLSHALGHLRMRLLGPDESEYSAAA